MTTTLTPTEINKEIVPTGELVQVLKKMIGDQFANIDDVIVGLTAKMAQIEGIRVSAQQTRDAIQLLLNDSGALINDIVEVSTLKSQLNLVLSQEIGVARFVFTNLDTSPGGAQEGMVEYDGSLVLLEDYPDLFKGHPFSIGDASVYKHGMQEIDGKEAFHLPNLTNRFPRGYTGATLFDTVEDSVREHVHGIAVGFGNNTNPSGYENSREGIAALHPHNIDRTSRAKPTTGSYGGKETAPKHTVGRWVARAYYPNIKLI